MQWMADSPAAYSALKFINKLTGTAQERYIRKLQGLHGGLGVPWNELLSPFDNQWIDDICKLPAVEFDASFILWRLQRAHTLEAMKAYRIKILYRLVFHIIYLNHVIKMIFSGWILTCSLLL